MCSKRYQRYLTTTSLVVLTFGLLVLTGCAPQIEKFTPEEGTVGTEVTIEGKRFKDTPAENTVKFSGVTVPTTDILSASTTEIKAKVPSGAKTGLISVTTSRGTGYSEKNFIIETEAKWTFMLYLDADNNLELDGIGDFLEMASVGSTDEINIVVQMDRVAGHSNLYGNWTGTRRFLIQSGDDPSVTPVQDLGEQNMGDPAVLQDFVEWAVTDYPAAHYALVIWNHGDGWRSIMERMIENARDARSRGEPDVGVARAVAIDDTNGDKLYMYEVQTALQAAKKRLEERLHTVVKLDVVGFDACLMGMVEVAYAIRDVANYMVGSENTEPLNGWPYDTILGELVAMPSMSPEDLADTVVTEYVDSYSSGSDVTQSAVNIAELNNLVDRINDFTNEANTEWNKLKTARTNAQQYHPPSCLCQSCWGIDLWDFADNVGNQVTSTDMKTAATDLKNAIDNFVISEGHGSSVAGSHGIAIYFPPTQTKFNNDPDHTGYDEANTFMPVDFVLYARWDNWLQDYYSNIP